MIRPDREVATTCPYCGVGCTLELHVKDDFVYKVTSPFDSPVNHGNLCVKGRFGYDYIYHPKRVLTPLIRKVQQEPGSRTQAMTPPPQQHQTQYGQTQYGQTQYGQPAYGQTQYGQPAASNPAYGAPSSSHLPPPLPAAKKPIWPWAVGGAAAVSERIPMARSDDLCRLIVQTIHDVAEQGRVVIVSHAASVPLTGRADVLRVLITASLDTRVQRVGRETGEGRARATHLVKDSDAARADYFQRFYAIDEELPTQYDLVVNTDALTPDETADILVAAARRRA